MAQKSIQTSRLSRSASLLGTGAQVGLNYLKYYGKKSITGNADKTDLHEQNAVAVYKTFAELKGGPLKVAQMLSIDQTLLPGPYAREFSQAQYSAPPLSYPLVIKTFKREFQKEPLELFDSFTPEAASGASIGQVHRAELKGHSYAVKVQYPGVAQSLKTDLAVVKPIAIRIIGLNESDMDPYFKEVEERLLEETNYTLELERSQELTKACSHLEGIRFPRYYPKLSTSKILTMDWMEGIPLDQFIATKASASVRNKIGQALWDFYHFQIHELQLFHADPHPGNFLVDGECLCPLDFGCTKRIDDDFYTKNFHLLKPSLLEDRIGFSKALLALGIILPSDSLASREVIMETVLPSIELLARPFRSRTFDFGDEGFMKSIYELGEQNSQNKNLKELRGQRGSPHSLYLNRAYFGLYGLLTRLGAKINPTVPKWIFEA